MAHSAAMPVDEVFPEQPVRQVNPGMTCSRVMQEQLPRVLRVPYPLGLLVASEPISLGRVLGLVYRCIATYLIEKAGFSRKTSRAVRSP